MHLWPETDFFSSSLRANIAFFSCFHPGPHVIMPALPPLAGRRIKTFQGE